MLLFADTLTVVLIALAVDAAIGDPDAVWRRVPHPVVWIGALIHQLDRLFNREADSPARRRAAGVGALMILLVLCGTAALALDIALRTLPGHPWTSGIVASVFIAQNSLYLHVRRVLRAFAQPGLGPARQAVSMVVGRDPDSLDEAGICRAAIETTAENFSDGVVAPVFWFVLLGLPGLALYKAINTADSMIGHRTPRYEAFGWAAARLDDVVNLAPARIAGMLLALGAPFVRGSSLTAMMTMLRDARLHLSPNAGWPEAAMAGALNVALAGPRRYGARVTADPFLNAQGRQEATPADIASALRLLAAGCAFQFLLIALLASVMG
jgi:adenosylcobinamide-phosphate synthase